MNIKSVLLVVLITCIINRQQLKGQTKQIDSLKRVLSTAAADSNKVKTYRQLFIETIDKVNADTALLIAKQQLKLAQDIHFDKGEAMAYKLLSVGYQTAGIPDKAIENSLKSLKIYEKLKDYKGMASAYSNIGVVCWDENDLSEALVNFKKSLDIFEKQKAPPENIWRSTLNIAITYQKQHLDSLALRYFIRSLDLSKNIKLKILGATSLLHIAEIYFNRRAYNISKDYVDKALKLIPDAHEAYPVSEIYLLLSKIYLSQHRFGEALRVAQTGLNFVKKENYRSQLVKNYLQLSDAYKALNNYQQAYKYHSLYAQLKDSLLNTQNIKKIDELQYNYKLETKEVINRELLKNKQLRAAELLLQKATIKSQYTVVAFISIALLLFIILSFVYYNGFKTKLKDNELLNLNQQKILRQNEEITAQNEEISNQKENLLQINNTKNKLFSIISHDLRSPVLTLQETLRLFNDQLLTHEDIEAMSAELLTNVESTTAMLDNVLYWAKSQMEGIRPHVQVFNIQNIIITNIGNFAKQAANKQITLLNQIDTAINVKADPSTIDIVLRNLLSNAIKFCSENDMITVSAKTSHAFAEISVTDTGLGMSNEVMQKLFTTVDYYSTYGTANEKGTGLGLNLCQDFIALNGGKIWVTSELGKGSSFTFTIPLT